MIDEVNLYANKKQNMIITLGFKSFVNQFQFCYLKEI